MKKVAVVLLMCCACQYQNTHALDVYNAVDASVAVCAAAALALGVGNAIAAWRTNSKSASLVSADTVDASTPEEEFSS